MPICDVPGMLLRSETIYDDCDLDLSVFTRVITKVTPRRNTKALKRTRPRLNPCVGIKRIPAAFSYPVGERVHCNTALCKDGDAFDVLDPGFATSANEWVAKVKRISASELVEIARKKRDVFVMSPRT
jgi:hypothetical protein